jgi:hypothetical protein
MEGDAKATATAADAVSKVLGEDLLLEIFLRLGFPNTLVCAAVVCKRWLHHIADKAFLRRFRKLNPPRLLGFYIDGVQGSPRFVPLLPQPPELAAAVRIVEGYGFCAETERVAIRDSRNASVFTMLSSSRRSLGVHSPLCPERAMSIDPPISPPNHSPFRLPIPEPLSFQILSSDEKGCGLSCFHVAMDFEGSLDLHTIVTAHVSMLQDGVWCMRASARTKVPYWQSGIRVVMVDNKIYMPLNSMDIKVLDLTTSRFSTIQLPQGVKDDSSDFMLSRADDASSVYLIELKELQLRIWLHKGESWSMWIPFVCIRCAQI